MSYAKLLHTGFEHYNNMENQLAAQFFRDAIKEHPYGWEAYLMLADTMWHYLEDCSLVDAYKVARSGYEINTSNAYMRMIIYFITDDLKDETPNVDYNFVHLRAWLEVVVALEYSWPYPKLLLAELLQFNGKPIPKHLIDDIKKTVGKVPANNSTLMGYLESQYTGRCESVRDMMLERLREIER